MKLKILTFTVVLLALIGVGCTHKTDTTGTVPSVSPAEVTPADITSAPDSPVTVTPDPATPEPTPDTSVTLIPLDDDDDPIGEDAPDTDTGEADDPEDEFDSEDYAFDDLSPAERREIVWSETLLVWIPEADIGTFREVSSTATFDFAVFDITSADETAARDYVSTLPAAGFSADVNTFDTATGFVYEASNAEGWCVSVVLDGSVLTIGSGYPEQKEDNESAVNTVWADPLVSALPLFGDGVLVSTSSENNGGEFHYAVFDNVTDEYAAAYLDELKAAGFTIDADEGVMGGIIWYTASNTDSFVCDYLYSDHVVKIGCGIYSD